MDTKRRDDFVRDVPFDLTRGDGQTFYGYAAVFDSPTRIQGWDGDFDEQIAHGAFTRTLSQHMPVLMFEHGRHPLIGDMPLGTITDAREDQKGLYIEARLTDNWLIQPVRDAVDAGAVKGMSFRFTVPEHGDKWEQDNRAVPLRTLVDIDVPELGPVVFPAYEPTTANVRSILDKLTHEIRDTADPVVQAQAADAALDEAVNLLTGVKLSSLPPNVQQAIGLVYAAQSTVDELLEIMDIYDPDDPDSKGKTGRSSARSKDGGLSTIPDRIRKRDRLLRMKGILHS